MTKRIICTILALVFCFSLAVSVSAASAGTAFVIDEIGYLTDDEVTALNRLGAAYYDACGVGIFFVYTQADSLRDYDVEAVVNGITDYVLMVENESSWYVHVGGKGEIIDTAAEDALRAAYDADDTYVGGVDALIDWDSKAEAITLMRYMDDKCAKEDKVFDDPSLMRTPIVRNGKLVTLGYCPEIWAQWE